jgi:hypothetical protein
LGFSPTEAGLMVFGILVGWLLAYTIRREGMKWKHFFIVVMFLGGGSIGSYSLDVIFRTSSFGYFWIGVGLGFFANFIVRVIAEQKKWNGAIQLTRLQLDKE